MTFPTHTTRLLAASLAAAALAGCQYDSRLVEQVPLPDELVAASTPYELEGTRETEVRATVTATPQGDRLVIEEVTTAQFRTNRTYVPHWEDVYEAEFTSELVRNAEPGSYWIFPHTCSYVDTYIEDDDNVFVQVLQGTWGSIAYVLMLPFETIPMLISDVVLLPFNPPIMAIEELNHDEAGEPFESPLVEDKLVRRVSHTATAEDVQVRLGPGIALVAERDAQGDFLFDSAELLAFDAPPDAPLEVTYRLDGELQRVHVDLPADWIEKKRDRAGFRTAGATQDLPPRAKIDPRIPATLVAGVPTPLAIDVTNVGKGDFQALVGVTRSDDPYLNGRVFHFGEVAPGETASADVTIHVPRRHQGGEVHLAVDFREANGREPASVPVRLDIGRLPRPQLLATWRIIDDNRAEFAVGNGDGRIQRREAFELVVRVSNEGRAPAVAASARLDADQLGLRLLSDHELLGDLPPGAVTEARFTVEVTPGFRADQLDIELLLAETGFREDSVVDIDLPLDDHVDIQPAHLDRTLWVRSDSTQVREGAGPSSRVLYDVSRGTRLHATAVLEDDYRVELDVDGATAIGWVSRHDVSRQAVGSVAATEGGGVVLVRPNVAPLLSVSSPSEERLRTTEARLPIVASAADDVGVVAFGVRLDGRDLDIDTRDLGNIRPRVRDETIGGPSTPVESHRTVSIQETLTLTPGMHEVVVFAEDATGARTERRYEVELVQESRETFLAVIGINDYEDDQIPDLRFAESDARALFASLQSGLDVPDDQAWSLLGEDATRFGIIDLLTNRIGRAAGPEDTVVVYFAGHGATEPDATRPDGLAKYFVPHDAQSESLPATGIPTDAVAQYLDRIPSERLVFIADACFSGESGRSFSRGGFRANLSDDVYDEIATRSGRVILAACAAREVAAEADGHGLFTAALLDALQGAADVDGDRLITVSEVYTYCGQVVREKTGGRQNPALAGTFEGSPVLADLR